MTCCCFFTVRSAALTLYLVSPTADMLVKPSWWNNNKIQCAAGLPLKNVRQHQILTAALDFQLGGVHNNFKVNFLASASTNRKLSGLAALRVRETWIRCRLGSVQEETPIARHRSAGGVPVGAFSPDAGDRLLSEGEQRDWCYRMEDGALLRAALIAAARLWESG